MLSTTAEYALRALVYMARQPQGSAVLGRKLAQAADIPGNYLSKILLVLRNAGFVATTRGTGGGYRLNRKPEEIYLIDVVELFDGPKSRPTCFLGHTRPCADATGCSAHSTWRDLNAAFRGLLVSTSVATIASEYKSGNGTPSTDKETTAALNRLKNNYVPA